MFYIVTIVKKCFNQFFDTSICRLKIMKFSAFSVSSVNVSRISLDDKSYREPKEQL